MQLRTVLPLSLALGFLLYLTQPAAAADPPSVKFAIEEFRPKHGDVEFDTPDPKTYAACKVDAFRTGKTSGWVVLGPQGQTLRRFMDTNGDDTVDQWSYYRGGLEVYRDSDTNGNNKIDQSRWLNTGGSRWGIDKDEDGKIDYWKMISAEEVSRVAVRALATQDATLLAPLLVTRQDLAALGIKDPIEGKILSAVSEPAAKLKKIAGTSKLIGPKTTWMRFDGSTPSVIPADQLKTPGDLVVYENAMAIVESGQNTGLVALGELVRMGDVWKMTSLPQPLEGKEIVLESGLLMQPEAGGGTLNVAAAPAGISPEAQKLIEELQELDKNPPAPTAARPAVARFHATRADILEKLRGLAKSEEERGQWTRQQADGVTAAVQIGAYPAGIQRLKLLEASVLKDSPRTPLAAYITYRRMLAEYSQGIHEAETNEGRQKIQDRWLTDLEKFVTANPTAEDAPDAILQLAIAEEFNGKAAPARKWYEALVKDHAKTPAGERAAGALKRLDLDGKSLVLAGKALGGGTIDIKQFAGKKVLVFFWATWCKPCTEDLPQIKAIYDEHRKDFEILGINLDTQPNLIAPYLAQYKVTWPQILEPGGLDGETARQFGIIQLPTMFLVDATGKVVNRSTNIADLKATLSGPVKEDVKKEALRGESKKK